MEKNVFLALVLGALSFTACKKTETIETNEGVEVTKTANAVEYKVSTDESVVKWKGEKISGENHYGTIKISEGTIKTLEGKIVGGNFVIDMNSIVVEDIEDAESNEKLVGHLKGSTEEKADHFFNVSKFPTASFEIAKVEDAEEGQKITGNLTIKETTKSIEFTAKATVSENEVIFEAPDFAFDRTEFGVNFNSGKFVQDLGDKAIKDAITIKFVVKATK